MNPKPTPRRLVRFGHVRQAILEVLALNGPSLPWQIYTQIKDMTSDGAVYKALQGLTEWGWVRRFEDATDEAPIEAGGQMVVRCYYDVTHLGWDQLETRLRSTGRWSDDFAEARTRFRLRTTGSHAVQLDVMTQEGVKVSP
jgi:hypothetical protein